ncbi:hypothetical protein [Clostridioides sp. ZZV14-6345]|uniref:hypothetical protein n=1 Tax=Clostridioides sp. ZZV14-6345 TaxID=2811496 RepID=UPI001D129801|nr:hypothetical protein [Clostridioides sp. ZZV14-6345]
MQENKEIWLYSWDDEYFESDEYESKKDAVEAAKEELRELGELKDFEQVYVGKREDVSIPSINVEYVLEHVQELIDDGFGEVGEGWITRIEVEDRIILSDRLNKVFLTWIEEFGHNATWFKIVDVEEIEIVEEVAESE